MAEPRSVVITGASRGLGLASATRLYQEGWHVVGAMRSPDAGLERLRAATGAAAGDPRLIGVRLDVDDAASIAEAAREIEKVVGAPYALVHNAGIAGVACVEEAPDSLWQQIFSTNLFGPVRLTQALLPTMRSAGRGRIVVVSSQGGARGMASISAYSAAKGALERWAEALAPEVAPFGIGVTVLVAGTFKTDILEETAVRDFADFDGPYAQHHAGIRRTGDLVIRLAARPERFAAGLAKAVNHRAPFTRRAVGVDARLMLLGSRYLPARAFHAVATRAMGLPRAGSLRGHPLRLATITATRKEGEQDG